MMLVTVRGKAMNWVYFCPTCELKLWDGFGGRKKPKCELCGERFDAPLSVRFCRSCSYETGICMGCGAKIKIKEDYDTLVEKALNGKPAKKKKRRKK